MKLLHALFFIILSPSIHSQITVDFAVSPTTICETDTIWLNDLTTGGGGTAWREWEVGGMYVDDISAPSTFATPTIGLGGIDDSYIYVKLMLIDSTEGWQELTKDSVVHVFKVISSLSANALDTTICEGDTTQLLASNSGNDSFIDSWVWTPNSSISNDTLQNPFGYPTSNQTYTVTAINGICPATDSVSIYVNPSPPTPSISSVGAYLISSSTTNNQWYQDGILMTGETNDTLVPMSSGNYTVVVTNAFGCSSESLPYSYTFTEVIETTSKTLDIYPNPFDYTLTINVQGEFELLIYSTVGELIYTKTLIDQNVVDLSYLTSGIYLVTIKSKDLISSERIIKR